MLQRLVNFFIDGSLLASSIFSLLKCVVKHLQLTYKISTFLILMSISFWVKANIYQKRFKLLMLLCYLLRMVVVVHTSHTELCLMTTHQFYSYILKLDISQAISSRVFQQLFQRNHKFSLTFLQFQSRLT
jgi:hypothetical protein